MQAYLPQLPQSEKPTTSTLPNFLPKLPSTPQSRQTQVRFLSNAKEFTAKRRSVSDKTSKSFLPNAKTFPPPSYLPTLLFPESTYKNTPKPLPESSRHAQFMRQ